MPPPEARIHSWRFYHVAAPGPRPLGATAADADWTRAEPFLPPPVSLRGGATRAHASPKVHLRCHRPAPHPRRGTPPVLKNS
eukprot:gene11187-biopygen301